MRLAACTTIALTMMLVHPAGQEVPSDLMIACTQLLADINGPAHGVSQAVKQTHREVTVTNTDEATGDTATVVCLFRNLADPVPELVSLKLNDHSPLRASDHPEWNEFIWNYFVAPPS